jgi:hypothetical protein
MKTILDGDIRDCAPLENNYFQYVYETNKHTTHKVGHKLR